MNPSLDALREAHQELRKAVPAKRREARQAAGPLHTMGALTFKILDQMKAEGASSSERDAYLIGVLQHILAPIPGQAPCRCPRCAWLCTACEDTGAIIERQRSHLYGGAFVDVVVPCACPKGNRFRLPSKAVHAEDYTQAGKTRKTQPKGWSMGGR